MNVTKMKNINDAPQNELHQWIDTKVPQIIEEEAINQNPEIELNAEQVKQIELEVTKLLKKCFK